MTRKLTWTDVEFFGASSVEMDDEGYLQFFGAEGEPLVGVEAMALFQMLKQELEPDAER